MGEFWFNRVIGIGWDVGGWMGTNHGVAICEWEKEENTVHWLGEPREISIPKDGVLKLSDITKSVYPDFDIDSYKNTLVVIGIDAPLGFPIHFKRLLSGEEITIVRPKKEIQNELAYRFTDRWIHEEHGKKPLSASFDRLGNNATLAMLHMKKWEKENGFKTYPFSASTPSDHRVMIEVYPALLKASKYAEAINGIKPYLPKIEPGTDAYDACLCALYAIAFGTNGIFFPTLEHPPVHEQVREEGWIYSFSKESLETLKR